jgi:hypothetical protein
VEQSRHGGVTCRMRVNLLPGLSLMAAETMGCQGGRGKEKRRDISHFSEKHIK